LISDQLFAFLNRLVGSMSFEILGMALGWIVAARMTRSIRASMSRRFLERARES
jgi:hypothetical protein